jgi:hypothetical protein
VKEIKSITDKQGGNQVILVVDMYNENYKTLKKEIEKDIHKRNNSHIHGFKKLIL